MKHLLIFILSVIFLLWVSFMLTTALVYLVSQLAPFEFTWKLAGIVWLILILFKMLFVKGD